MNLKKLFKKIYYIGGTIYRGLIGVWHNHFDKAPRTPDDIKRFVIGTSVEGREIKCYEIRNKKLENEEENKSTSTLAPGCAWSHNEAPGLARSQQEGKLLIVAGIHGNEVGTVKLACHIINWFYDICGSRNAIYGVSKDVVAKRDAINRVSTKGSALYVIPVLNPDGYEQALKNPDYWHRGEVGRFNARGVDLNRNFPTKDFRQWSEWGRGKDYTDEKQKIFCGESSASEPEIQALINLIKQEDIKNLIMLHNTGSDVIINKEDKEAFKWAVEYEKIGFKIRYDLNYSGSAAQWAQENTIHYMTVEGSTRWGSDRGRQKGAIVSIVSS